LINLYFDEHNVSLIEIEDGFMQGTTSTSIIVGVDENNALLK